jgi:hypothetical protein
MSLTYKDDDSFFTTVYPPFIYYGFSVKKWFAENGMAKFRFLRDYESEREFWNLEKIDDYYPGIKTISITVNPWARVRHMYNTLSSMKQAGDNSYFNAELLDQIPLENFNKFVYSLPNVEPVSPFWFSLSSSTTKWTEYNAGGVIKSVDYVLREGHFEEDFAPIQEYFCTTQPLDMPNKFAKYRSYYNKGTRTVVEQLFTEEINRFGYNF